MTKGLLTSLKLKQNHKKDFLKVKIHKIKRFINNANLFLKVQRKSWKNYCKDCLKKCWNDVKKAWNVIKEIIEKSKLTKGNIPTRMILDGYGKFDQGKRANCFVKFFIDIGPKIVSIIPESQIKFDLFLNPHQTILGEGKLKKGS